MEKRRRGREGRLVFVGMANVASYYWCTMKSVLHSRAKEEGFFEAYLSDRLEYSFRLGLIDEIPRSDKKLLEVGDEITFNDVEKLLREKAQKMEPQVEDEVDVWWTGVEVEVNGGQGGRYKSGTSLRFTEIGGANGGGAGP